MLSQMSELAVTQTDIAGLYEVTLLAFPDSRGSFREAYQAEKLESLGLPKLGPVQWNISNNNRAGIIRGIHAEPWDKYIHVISGRALAVIVDLRPESKTFGQHKSFELDTTKALFVSRGLGNAYQTLEPHTIYGYLVNAHWSPGTKYPSIRYNDPDLQIAWPIAPSADDVSEKDQVNPTMRDVFPDRFSS